MLTIDVASGEFYDHRTETFETIPAQRLRLEHSLLSISEWESKWHKSFLNSDKSAVEMLDYIRCMTVSPKEVNPLVYQNLTEADIRKITEYIENPMTATTITERQTHGRSSGGRRSSGQTITSELIYSWMIDRGVPMPCEKWHLNRLLTLIRVCDANNTSNPKMAKRDILSQYSAINAARRAKHHTRG